MNTFLEIAGQRSTKTGLKAGVHTTNLHNALYVGDLTINPCENGFVIKTLEGDFMVDNNTALLSALQPIYTKAYTRGTWLSVLAGGFLSTQQQSNAASREGETVSPKVQLTPPTSKDIIKSIVIDLLNDNNDSLLDDIVQVVITGQNAACNIGDSLGDRVEESDFFKLYKNEKADRDLFSTLESFGFYDVKRAGVELSMKVQTDVAGMAIPEAMALGHTVTATTTDWNTGTVSVYLKVNEEVKEVKEVKEAKEVKEVKKSKSKSK